MIVRLDVKKLEGRRVIVREFESIGELTMYMEKQPVNQRVFWNNQASVTGSYEFTKTRNFDEAKDLLFKGWDAGAKKLTSELKVANAKAQDKFVQRAVFDVVGFQASVPRYLQGIPTNMVNKVNVKQKQRVVTLSKMLTYQARVKADEILEDSVKFLQIVQAIERKGIRVNVNVIFHTIKQNEEIFYKVRIKSSSERLNISKMSFPLIHPSFLRRIIFRAMEVEGELTRTDWSFGYGRPATQQQTQQLVDKNNETIIPTLINMRDAQNIVENIK